MKCNKCGNELRTWINPQTNQNMASCDSCKYDTPIFNSQYSQANPLPQKNSGLSIVALILSISGCFCFIGLILGIIDLVKKDKVHKHTLSIVAIIVAAVWIVLSMALGGSGDSSSSNNSESTVVEQKHESDTDTDISTSTELLANDSEESSPAALDDNTAEASSETESESVPEISEEDFKASCQPFDYKTIARNPDDYIGQNFVVDVKIFQTANGKWYSDYDVYYKAYTNDEYDLWMGDFLYVIDCQNKDSESYLKVLDDDIIRVYGTFNGMTESSNALTGTTNEEIALDMYYCELISE